MVRVKPGDKVACRLKEGNIVVSYKEYDDLKSFEVIAISEDDCYIFIPEYIFIKDTVEVTPYRCKRYDIDPRFLGERMAFISESMICSVHRMDGKCCSACQDFILMAEANQEDGTFICFTCRQSPYH